MAPRPEMWPVLLQGLFHDLVLDSWSYRIDRLEAQKTVHSGSRTNRVCYMRLLLASSPLFRGKISPLITREDLLRHEKSGDTGCVDPIVCRSWLSLTCDFEERPTVPTSAAQSIKIEYDRCSYTSGHPILQQLEQDLGSAVHVLLGTSVNVSKSNRLTRLSEPCSMGVSNERLGLVPLFVNPVAPVKVPHPIHPCYLAPLV